MKSNLYQRQKIELNDLTGLEMQFVQLSTIELVSLGKSKNFSQSEKLLLFKGKRIYQKKYHFFILVASRKPVTTIAKKSKKY